VEHARKLITTHQFNNEPFRILLASLSSGLRATDAFITSTLQKHLFREIKMADTAVKDPGSLKWNPINKRYAFALQGKTSSTGAGGGEEEDAGEDDVDDAAACTVGGESQEIVGAPKIPAKHNPIIVTIYGQICIAARSYQSAICMFSSVLFRFTN
jgi:general transcription factor 3C polypeptide 3 (transcription factor C subunit 4)